MTYVKKPRLVKHYDAKESEWIWSVSVTADGIPTLKAAEKFAAEIEQIAVKLEGQSVLTN